MGCEKNDLLRCRTCFEPNEIYHLLDDVADPILFPGKSLLTILEQLTNNELKPELRNILPKYICETCTQKVKNAFAFVQQAQYVSNKLLANFHSSKPDCLLEAPIDIPVDTVELRIEIGEHGLQTHYDEASLYQALESNTTVKEDPITVIEIGNSKFEENDSSEHNYALETISYEEEDDEFITIEQPQEEISLKFTCEECGNSYTYRKELIEHMKVHLNNSKYECNVCGKQFMRKDKLNEHMKNHKKTKILPQRNRRLPAQYRDDDEDGESIKEDEFKCEQCDKPFQSSRDLSRHKKMHLTENEKFNCPHCDRKFNRKDNMKAHMKKHTEAGKKGFHMKDKKVKGVDPNLCKPNGCKVIQCMICLSKHAKIADLRTHLLLHQNMSSFPQRNSSIEEISLQFYPDEEPLTVEENLVERIMSDIKRQNFAPYYSITNEVGYELSLSCSETGSDSDNDDDDFGSENSTIRKYHCSICNLYYSRKYKLFQHQMWDHHWEEASFICIHCKSRFLSRELLLDHNMKECKNTRKRYHCKKCPRRFMWMDNLKSHMQMMHSEMDEVNKDSASQPRAFTCEECHCCFHMEKDLTRHMLMHRSDNCIFRCLWCARKFYHKTNLLMHVRLHGVTPETFDAEECVINATKGPNGSKEIYCKSCNIRFDKISALRKHLFENHKPTITSADPTISHFQEYNSSLNYSIINELGFEMDLDDSETDDEVGYTQYVCEICNIKCKRKYEIAQHQRSIHKHEQVPLTCDKCVFRTVSKLVLDHHKRTNCYNDDKQFQCTLCPYKFMWLENLQNHINQMHPNKPTSSEALEPELQLLTNKVFSCDKCGKKYSRKNWLLTHIEKNHSESSNVTNSFNNNPNKNNATKPQKEKKFLCTFCGRGVSSSSSLIIHMRRHTGEKPFKCDFCDMAFPRSSDLMGHRRKHTGERPHKCTVCSKAFARLYKLKTHMRIHSGEKPYKCTHCDKCFAQSNDMTLHVRRHTGELPYICGICGERFIQSSALKNHRIMRGHFEEPETLKVEVF